MLRPYKILSLVVFLALLSVVVTIAGLLFWLPGDIRIGLSVWMLASLPIGALIGHCILSEQNVRIQPFPPPPAASNGFGRVAGLAGSNPGEP